MRYKNKLSQRGKGNRRNRRFVSLSKGDFEKVDYYNAAHGISAGDKRTSVPIQGKATREQAEQARRSEERHKSSPTYHDKPPLFRALRVVKLPDGREVLQ